VSRGSKIAIVILVILAILFIVSMTVGMTRDDDSEKADPEKTDWIQKSKSVLSYLFTEETVNPKDIVASSCGNNGGVFVFSSGPPCEITIRSHRAYILTYERPTVRSLKLVLDRGRKVNVVLEPRGKSGLTAKFPLRTEMKESRGLQVREDGAVLQLTCNEPDPLFPILPCQVRLKAQ
jgi:hypothetical protein